MKDRRLDEEERRQREKEELSRQRMQDQAYREAQRGVYNRIYGQQAPPSNEYRAYYHDLQYREPGRPPGSSPHPSHEAPPPPKKKKKRWRWVLLILLLLIACMSVSVAVIHALFVKAPVVPSQEEAQGEGTHPELLEAGRREEVYTFLLVGRDDGGGGNTDTMMVGCFDAANGTLDVLSLYRDTLVDVPWDPMKLNSVYNYKGLDGLKEEIRDLIGYAPDYHFVLELDIVSQLVDAIGGVDYYVPYNMDYDDPTQDLHIHFDEGMQHLNGEDAVKVLRWRKNNSGEKLSVGDIGRVEVQHSFLKAFAKQALSLSTLANLKEVLNVVDENLSSNLTYGEMIWFGEKALGMAEGSIRFHNLPGDASGSLWSPNVGNYQSYVFVNDTALLELVNAHMNPYVRPITEDMQHIIHATTVNNTSGSP